jgi:predicted nucleic acid-binding protein
MNTADGFHTRAKKQWRDLLGNADQLITNNYVLIETIAILQRRHGLGLVQNLQTNLLPLVTVEWLDEAHHNEAIQNLFAASRRRLSLVDCAAFATMRRLEVQRVFTFDSHFAEQGFEVLPEIK